MARKSESSFEEGDFVVYPTHGVGRILGTEEREVAGMKLEMLVVRFEHDRMTLRVPMEKARGLGLRTLSSKKQMEQAITTLQGKAKVRRTMWSRRAQEYETKIKSGDPVSIAEVVRDLHRRTNQSEQSYSERQMYQAALERLAREFAAIEKLIRMRRRFVLKILWTLPSISIRHDVDYANRVLPIGQFCIRAAWLPVLPRRVVIALNGVLSW